MGYVSSVLLGKVICQLFFHVVALRTLLGPGTVVHNQMVQALRAIWSLLALLPLPQATFVTYRQQKNIDLLQVLVFFSSMFITVNE